MNTVSRVITISALTLTVIGCTPTTGGAIGGVTGGIVGHQVGDGRGQEAATAIGAAVGSTVGSDIARQLNAASQNSRARTRGPRDYNPGEAAAYYEGRSRYLEEKQRERERQAYEYGYQGR